MIEYVFCWCGHPITVEDLPDVQGERQVYTDGKNGRVTDTCPGCGDWPLDLSRLLPDPKPARPIDSKSYKED